jgi:hypothetical protein
MPSEEFEPAITATRRLQTYALDRAATGISSLLITNTIKHRVHALESYITGIYRQMLIKFGTGI